MNGLIDVARLPRCIAARLGVRLLESIADEQASREGRFPGEPDVSRERLADTLAQLRLYSAVVPQTPERPAFADVRAEDFEPEALRGHAEVLDGLAHGLSLHARGLHNPEDMLSVDGSAEDCRLFAAVFRGLARRLEPSSAPGDCHDCGVCTDCIRVSAANFATSCAALNDAPRQTEDGSEDTELYA
jgi:hypothetical protein